MFGKQAHQAPSRLFKAPHERCSKVFLLPPLSYSIIKIRINSKALNINIYRPFSLFFSFAAFCRSIGPFWQQTVETSRDVVLLKICRFKSFDPSEPLLRRLVPRQLKRRSSRREALPRSESMGQFHYLLSEIQEQSRARRALLGWKAIRASARTVLPPRWASDSARTSEVIMKEKYII